MIDLFIQILVTGKWPVNFPSVLFMSASLESSNLPVEPSVLKAFCLAKGLKLIGNYYGNKNALEIDVWSIAREKTYQASK